MLVHRIAHPLVLTDHGRACGPYNAGSVATNNRMDESFIDTMRDIASMLMDIPEFFTPAPTLDGLNGMRYTESSVFLSIPQAERWFCWGNDELREAGFRLFTYDVPERYVSKGYYQAKVNLRRARLVSIQDIPFVDTFEPIFCGDCNKPEGRCFCWLDDDDDTCGDCLRSPFFCEC